MAQNLAPSHWLSGYELTDTNTKISIPIASLSGLDASEANGSTGDIRKVLRALMATLHAAWLAEAAADRPQQMTVSRSSSVNDSTGETVRTYQAQFRVATTGEEVVDEPSAS